MAVTCISGIYRGGFSGMMVHRHKEVGVSRSWPSSWRAWSSKDSHVGQSSMLGHAQGWKSWVIKDSPVDVV